MRLKRSHFSPHSHRQIRDRRLNGRDYIKLFGHQFAVGREHAGKVVTVLLEEIVAQIFDGERLLRLIVIDRQLLRE